MNKFTTSLLTITFLVGCANTKNNITENSLSAPVRVCDSEENGWCFLKGRYEILNVSQNENVKTWHLKIDSQSNGYPIVKLAEPITCQQRVSNQVRELSRNIKVDDEDGSWNLMKVSFSDDDNCNMQLFIPASSKSLAINNFFQVNIGICTKNDQKNRSCNQLFLADFIRRIEIGD